MRLELATFPVENIVWGDKTAYQDRVLSLNREELVNLVGQEAKIASIDLEIVHPGDKVRIVGIRDAVEPRVKARGPGEVFPGILGPVQPAGQGVTHRLAQMAVIACAYYRSSVKAGTGAPTTSLLDMWGPGAAVTPFGSTHNLVLIMKLAEGISENEAHAVIQMAELRLARRLAQTTLELVAPQVEVFELTPAAPSLPKVVYLLGVMTGPNPHINHYGLPVFETLPTLVHPNEFLDGAITVEARTGKDNVPRTWLWQNQPVVQGLCRAHGKRLNFLGVILHRMSANTYMGKQIGALRAAQVAKLLGAEGAVITRVNVSGNRFVDIMLAVQACEQQGIKTVFVSPEYGGKEGDELPFLFTVPEARSIVSAGSFERTLELPRPDRVIGPQWNHRILMELDPTQGREPEPADVPLTLYGWDNIAGGVDWWGGGHIRCNEY